MKQYSYKIPRPNARTKLQDRFSLTKLYMRKKGYNLFTHQLEGVNWMLKRELSKTTIKGGLLCDEPGLGKTIQVLATMYSNPKDKTLIIVPNSVLVQWIDKIKSILPNDSIYIHHGKNRSSTMFSKNKITITTLGMICNRKKNIIKTDLHSSPQHTESRNLLNLTC